jgi:hypothetical protein
MTTEKFFIKFGGSNFVEADLMLASLNSVITVITELNNTQVGKSNIQLSIETTKQSSFEICFTLASLANIGLLAIDNQESIASLIELTKDIFSLVKHLCGHKPKEIIKNKDATTTITNIHGDSATFRDGAIVPYFNNCNLQNAVINMIAPANKYERPYVELRNSKSSVKTTIDEYASMMQPTEFDKRTKQVEESRYLYIRKPDLNVKSEWSFISDGRTIRAEIKDTDFLDKIRNGQPLYHGCGINCKMIIEYELDADDMPIEGKIKYTVTEVVGEIIEPSKQRSLDI